MNIKKILKNEVVINVGWNFVSNVLSKVAVLLTNIIVAYLFTKEDYGLSGFIRTNNNLFISFGTFGFGIAATKFIAQSSDKEKASYSAIIRMTSFIPAFLLALACFFFAKEIAIFAKNEVLTQSIRISSFAILFLSLNAIQLGLLNGLKNFKVIANITLLSSLVTAVVTIAFSRIWTVDGYSLGLSVGAFFSWVYTAYHLRRLGLFTGTLSFLTKDRMSQFYSVLKISIPAVLSGLSVMPANWLANTIIMRTELGALKFSVYNAAQNITIFSIMVINVFGQVLLPYAINKYNQKDQRFENINYYLPWVLGLALSIPMMLFPELISFVYGGKYVGSEFYYTIILLAFNNVIMSQKQGIAKNFIASGKMWISFWGNTLWGVTLILVLYNIDLNSSVEYTAAYTIAYLVNSMVVLPIYLKMGLIDRELLVSKMSLYMTLLTILVLMVSFLLPLSGRIVFFVILLIVFGGYSLKLLKKELKNGDK